MRERDKDRDGTRFEHGLEDVNLGRGSREKDGKHGKHGKRGKHGKHGNLAVWRMA